MRRLLLDGLLHAPLTDHPPLPDDAAIAVRAAEEIPVAIEHHARRVWLVGGAATERSVVMRANNRHKMELKPPTRYQ